MTQLLPVMSLQRLGFRGLFFINAVVLLVLFASTLLPVMQHLANQEKVFFHQRESAEVSRFIDRLHGVIEKVALQQQRASQDLSTQPELVLQLLGNQPAVARWRYVDATAKTLLDVGPQAGLPAQYDRAVLRHQLQLAASRAGHGSWVTRVYNLHLNANDARRWLPQIMVITPRYDATNLVEGFWVSNIDLYDDLQRLGQHMAAIGMANTAIVDQDGHYFFNDLGLSTHEDFHEAYESLAIDDYDLYDLIRRRGNGQFQHSSGVVMFSEIDFSTSFRDVHPIQIEPNSWYVVQQFSRDQVFGSWLQKRPTLWALLAALLALIGAVSAWGAKATVQHRRLLEQMDALQSRRILASQKQAEAEAAEQAKTAFLSNMSHEMRTPLNGIFGVAQIMQMGVDSREHWQRLLAMLSESAERLHHLLGDILDAGSIERRELRLNPQAFDARELLLGIIDQQTLRAREKGLAFEVDLDGLERGQFIGDKQRIGQIIDNLLNNAIKFTDHGFVSLRGWEDGLGLNIEVCDSGIGMTPAVQQKIFERFEQGDLSVKKRHQGAGLGLSICRDLAAMMGGNIDVTSQLGKGSCFTLQLPLPHGEYHRDEVMSDEVEQMPARILLVDDDETNRLVLENAMLGWGFDCSVVDSGIKAIVLLQQQPFDLLVTDISMPDISGTTLMQNTREIAPGMPCVAITGNAHPNEITELYVHGFKDVFAKPFEFEHLRMKILHLLRMQSRVSSPVHTTRAISG